MSHCETQTSFDTKKENVFCLGHFFTEKQQKNKETLHLLNEDFPQLDVIQIGDSQKRWSLALSSDGQLHGTGNNTEGQLGTVKPEAGTYAPLNLGFKVKQISVGVEHTVMLTDDGRVFCLGNNDYGQLGNEDTNSGEPVMPCFPKNQSTERFVSVHAGRGVSYAITHDNMLYGWGENASGALGRPIEESKENSISSPVEIMSLSNIKTLHFVKSGYAVVYVTNEDEVFGFGNNVFGIFEEKENKCFYSAKKQSSLCNKGIIQIESSLTFLYYLTNTGKIFKTGEGISKPKEITIDLATVPPVKSIASVLDGSLIVLFNTGEVYAFGMTLVYLYNYLKKQKEKSGKEIELLPKFSRMYSVANCVIMVQSSTAEFCMPLNPLLLKNEEDEEEDEVSEEE